MYNRKNNVPFASRRELVMCIALAAGLYALLVLVTKCITKSEFSGKGTS